MLLGRYQEEMQKLRILAEEFVKKHPKAASVVGGPSADPDVERLLEGTAFLSALLRERLEDDWPEVVHPLIRRTQPRWLRCTPAATVVSFTPNLPAKCPLIIPKGARISSVPVNGVSCHFTTCTETLVHPLTLIDARFIHLPGKSPTITLEFSLNGISLADWNAATLPLFLGGNFSDAADLYLLLSRYLEHLLVDTSEGTGCCLTANFPSAGSDYDPLLFQVSSASKGLSALLDYFTCPEKFLFVEAVGLDRWRARGSGSRFTLSFILKNRLPVAPPLIDAASFILAATPAVNLFPHPAEPIRPDGSESYRVVPSGKEKEHCRVWSVDTVTGFLKGSSVRKRCYVPR